MIIGTFAFSDCYGLKYVKISNIVMAMNDSVLQHCYCLVKVIIPDSVTTIGITAFQNCYNLRQTIFLSTTPPTLANANAFAGIPASNQIYVPDASLNAYKTATNWVTYANHIHPMSALGASP